MMNDKLKHLVKQAGTDTSGKWMSLDHAQTFAELIVNECASEILKWKAEPFPLDPDFAAKMIKEHFGVE